MGQEKNATRFWREVAKHPKLVLFSKLLVDTGHGTRIMKKKQKVKRGTTSGYR